MATGENPVEKMQSGIRISILGVRNQRERKNNILNWKGPILKFDGEKVICGKLRMN